MLQQIVGYGEPRRFRSDKMCAVMARVLRPGGWLAIAFPGREHLKELRAFGLLGAALNKSDEYRARLAREFGVPKQCRIARHVLFEREAVTDAILMGPGARHLEGVRLECIPERVGVMIEIIILLARP